MLSSLWNFSKNFQGCITVQLSRCFVLTVFDTQLVYIIMRLTRCQHLFLRFLIFLKSHHHFSAVELHSTISLFACQLLDVVIRNSHKYKYLCRKWAKKRNLNLLRFFFSGTKFLGRDKGNGERGIWTLAPRERPTPLAGAPLQPLEYFSLIWIMPLPIFN